eukprot:SAG31_NODE_1046_length_10177_cov_13.677218_6_plen_53_part_00
MDVKGANAAAIAERAEKREAKEAAEKLSASTLSPHHGAYHSTAELAHALLLL